ncbi:MAG: hypothetical protein R2704_06040 [Microthrixaceae bacterium]
MDDLAGAADTKGLRGHLLALTRGEVTTGAVKIGAIGASGLAAALLAGRTRRVRADRAGSRPRWTAPSSPVRPT